MGQEYAALLLDEVHLTLDELALSCTVSREWIMEHVEAGVLEPRRQEHSDPVQWAFGGQDIVRARRLYSIERSFDANPELAGLVADLIDEVERLRIRLRRAGLSDD